MSIGHIGEALRHPEQRWKFAIEASGDGLWDMDVDAGTTFYSARWKEMLGHADDEIGDGHHEWEDRLHPDDREHTIAAAAAHVHGATPSYQCEFRLRCKDGSWKWILSRGVATHRDTGGKALRVIGTHRDLTEYRKAQDELRVSEQSYRDQFTRNSSVMLLIDPTDGSLIEANAAAVRFYGYPRGILLSMCIMDITALETEAVRAAIASIPADEGAQLEFPHRLADGTVRTVEMSSTRVYFDRRPVVHAIIHDVTARKRAEEALRDSETRFRMIASNTSDGIIVVGPDHSLRYVSPAYLAQLGYSCEEELVRSPDPIRSLIHPEDRDSVTARVLDAIESKLPGLCYSYRAQRNDGSYIWREDSARFQFDQAGTYHGAYVVCRDITERMEAQGALEENREKYRALSEATEEAIFLSETGRCIEQNARAEAMFGYTNAEAVGRMGTDWIAPGDRDRVLRNMLAGVEAPYEVDALRRDGTTFPALLTPRMMRYRGRSVRVTSLRDLSRQKEAERVLRLEGAALNAVANAVVITDRAGRIEWVNPAFATMTGYSAEEALGHTPGELLKSGTHDEVFYRDMWATILAGKAFEGRVTNRRKDGSLYLEDGTITPLLGASGEVIHFIAVKQDITQRVALETQLRQSQKLEAVGLLAGGVAHDFNNMLGVILGTTECALDEVEAGTPMHDDLSEIRRAAHRSAALTRQLLSFARQQPIAPKVLNLNEIVANIFSMLQRLIGEDIFVDRTLAPDVWPVLMDPSQLDQILTNLCVNARDAIDDTGTITIGTSNRTVSSQVCSEHADAKPGDYVCICVRDSGSGMDAETMAHVFEPFFTTKAPGVGTGLGLATVYGAVRQNNGFIVVRSAVGKGTAFEIYLPRHVRRGPYGTVSSEARVARRGHETVLLVEDEAQLLRLTGRMLRAQGYRVLEAASPEEALRQEASHKGEIHLLLTDVVMRGMNGRDLATAVMARRPELKVMFMSGYTADVTAQRGIVQDGVGCLRKPFSATDLGTIVRRALYNDEGAGV